jgi:hypothetical protein
MSREIGINKFGNSVTVDIDAIKVMARNNQKIAIIKEFREVSGLGLKDSKEAVENYQKHSNNYNSDCDYDVDGLIELFSQHAGILVDPYTKEEFLTLIENAIDEMDTFKFTDMMEAVEALLSNVRQNGGLEQLAKDRDKFLRNI